MTVTTIGDLTIRHLGQRLTIPGLISPLVDYDPEALVSVEGTLLAITYVGIGFGRVPVVRVKLTDWIGALPLSHPCQLWEKL